MLKDLKEVLKEDFWIMPATPKYISKGIPYITSKNIKNGKIDFENVNYIDIEDYKKISKNRQILVDDILISMIGTIGETAIVKEKDGAFYGQNMFLVRLDENKICQRYFINYFKSNIVKRQLINKQNKSTQSYLKASHIESLKIPIPELNEQKKIANILDKVQEIIDLRKRQIEKLDELLKSQFIEMFGEPIINQKGFPVETIGDIIEFKGGSQPDKTYFEYVKKEDNIRLIQIRDYKTDDFITYIPKHLAKRFCKKDDIMIGRYGPPIFQILQGIEGAYNVALMKAIPKKGNKEFIRYFLKQECLLKYLEGMSQRTAGQAGIEMSKLKQYPFPYPPIELQNRFAEIVKQINKQKFVIEKSLKEAEELQESLMNKYFSFK